MTTRLRSRGLAVAAAIGAACIVAASLEAQTPARGSAELLAALRAKPTPRAGARPDLSGTWDHLGGIEFVQPRQLDGGSVCIRGCGGAGGGASAAPAAAAVASPGFPKYKPELLAKVKEFDEHQVDHDTVLQCQPPGVPRIGPPAKIVQGARELVFLYDDVNGSFFRVVPTDGRPHRKDLPASYLGDAVGRWDGDTLVVETVNFNEDTWLTDNGAFHSRNLKVIERLRRVGDTLEYQATAHDPDVLLEPWVARTQTLWITDLEIEESPRCEDRSLDHLVDKSHHTNPR